jgi:outer membrane biosynthesis protein TonB
VAPKPTPAKSAPPSRPAPAAAAKPPAKSLNLDALAASVAKAGKTSSAPKGPTRPETALQARDAAGAAKGLSASALAGLADELQRRWNPNCDVEGGKDVRIRATFTLGFGGQILGTVDAGGLENSSNPVIQAAAERAIRAIHQAAPFSTLPRDLFGQKVAVNFNAREACS